MAEFTEMEEIDAVRMVWNVWPHSRLEAAKCVIPFGVMYTPAKATRNLQVRGVGWAMNGLAVRGRARQEPSVLLDVIFVGGEWGNASHCARLSTE